MSIRKLMLVPVLLTAVSGPYLYMDSAWKEWVQDRASQVLGGKESEDPNLSLALLTGPAGGALAASNSPPGHPGSAAITDIREAMRFDVTPQWVLQRWPRVSTVRAADELTGLRVPLVTGTRMDDLSGSLTYYFDRDQKLQRLSFYGYTGDASRLIGLGTTHLNLKPEPSYSAGMYVQRWNGQPTSALRISHAPVVNAANPHARMIVQLEVNRPGAYFRLSPEFEQLLQYDMHTQRW